MEDWYVEGKGGCVGGKYVWVCISAYVCIITCISKIKERGIG